MIVSNQWHTYMYMSPYATRLNNNLIISSQSNGTSSRTTWRTHQTFINCIICNNVGIRKLLYLFINSGLSSYKSNIFEWGYEIFLNWCKKIYDIKKQLINVYYTTSYVGSFFITSIINEIKELLTYLYVVSD